MGKTNYDFLSNDKRPGFQQRKKEIRHRLKEFQLALLPKLRNLSLEHSKLTDKITIICYFFSENSDDFDTIEFSILQTYRCLGMMKTVIVTHREPSERLLKFAEKFPELITFRIDETLKPGDICSMSQSCIKNLYKFFTTSHCLIIQNDGFPIRHGDLTPFLKYDFVGATYIRDTLRQYAAVLYPFDSLNGGFSLRSNRYCREISDCWEKHARHKFSPESFSAVEDVFYTRTAPRLKLSLWLRYKISKPWVARKFSFDGLNGDFLKYQPKEIPIGVHDAFTFMPTQKYLDAITAGL